ncbi:unnamed protein product [Cuscuta epithymum]|uniref:AB hydrolase-1 domain-containing protein n=1 Tax=Cuscuta epithymum TaxID=186058 RepID=A0AAV0D3U4_9ASTE|nr:unnamed protein product [Cuscuta epithymum]
MAVAVLEQTKSVLAITGRVVNDILSFIVFSVLDILDFVLCYTYKVVDFIVEGEWKSCYCSSAKAATTGGGGGGTILVSEQGESKILRLTSSSKLQLEEVSDTLYNRQSVVTQMPRLISVNEVKMRRKVENSSTHHHHHHDNSKMKKAGSNLVRSTSFKINSAIVDILQGRIGGQQPYLPTPRWSDCDCKTCNSWASSCKNTLYVKVDGAKGNNVQEDVLFIHGFISSSLFWTETLFPNFSKEAKAKYRLFAVDLLGFGRSPKPNDSLYTLREHLDMIERSVLVPNKVKSLHIVAHSMGCILALALSVKHPGLVKSLTLIAPPFFPAPKGEQPTQHMLRKVGPRRVFPPMAFASSLACWYEHISRTLCLLISKNHRMWDFITKVITRNRIRRYLVEGFCCHTHNAVWHTMHNIICGTATKMEGYLEAVNHRMKCDVTVVHGRDDILIPLECSYNVQSRIPRAEVKVVDNKDHITIVVGRQEAFARELEQIWENSSST